MSNRYSRRDFLAVSAAAAAFSAVDASASSLFQEPRGAASVFVTDKTREFAGAGTMQWSSAPAAANEIVLDAASTFQPLLGFGAAFTDAACWTFNRLAAADRAALFHKLFAPSEMNLSVARICVGSSDYSRNVYSFDEGAPDPELTRFSIAHDRDYILPILREARAVNPDLFLLASPWSPPGWMKDNGSMLGGTIRRRDLETYAQYLARFLRDYAAAGVHVNSLTSQNEVDTDQDSRMPACTWPQEIEVGFVGEHLGPALRKANLDTQIWLIDHNYNLWGRAIAELDDPKVHEFAQGIAWHGYVGTPDLIDRVHQAHPDAAMYWTEGGPDVTSPTYATDWCEWGQTFTGVLRHWCRCIIGWNYALDEQGKPNVGPFSCGGVVTVHSQTKAITYSGQYRALGHFSRSLPRGAVRMDSRATNNEVAHVAARDASGATVLVLTNAGPEKQVAVRSGNSSATVTLPADSLVTVRWS